MRVLVSVSILALVGSAASFAACVGSDADDTGAAPADDAGTSGEGAVPTPPDAVDGAAPDFGATDAEVDSGPAPPGPPLPGPQLWLDARKLSPGTSGTWLDSSGNGANAVGNVPVTTVTDGINGRPAVRFLSEADQGMRVPADKLTFALDPGFAVFVVAKAFPKVPAPLYPSFVSRLTSPSRNGIWMYWRVPSSPLIDGALMSYATPIPNDVGVTITGATIYEAHVYALRVMGGLLSFSIDGAASTPSPLAGANPSFPAVNSVPFMVAGSTEYTSADYTFSGNIGSVSVYTRAVDDASMTAAIAKLKSDWGIP